MRMLRLLLVWLTRLPARFTVVLALLLLGYLWLVSALVTPHRLESLAADLLRVLRVPGTVRRDGLVALGTVGIVVLLLLGIGVLLSYNLAALIYRRVRKRPSLQVVDSPAAGQGAGDRLRPFRRIGIILAGGGAKGAYQAGALKAIHEFLEENGALDRVKMIAGTSIGSWNAMFWLAGLVKGPEGGRSTHERWWRSIAIDRIIEFDTYFPLRRNSFLRPTPWEETFDQIFMDTEAVRERLARLFPADGADPPVSFYLTRTNVELGHLEFATNRAAVRDMTRTVLGADTARKELSVKPDRYEIIADGDVLDCLRRTRRAVFASMDLPPLFPYMRIHVDRDEWFEDGGVVDNLPLRFGTEIEGCDLLFVLPLNASFAERVDRTSVSKRLFRVMDMRQGVMERASLKMVYLYNALARLGKEATALRAAAAPAQAGGPAPAPAGNGVGADAVERYGARTEHKTVCVFAIVPEAPLSIGTQEFWKPAQAGDAFDLMYEATKNELRENFERSLDPLWIRMTLVSPLGERTYFDDL